MVAELAHPASPLGFSGREALGGRLSPAFPAPSPLYGAWTGVSGRTPPAAGRQARAAAGGPMRPAREHISMFASMNSMVSALPFFAMPL